MSNIKCCYINILENSTVSLSAGTENPAYPLYRLYDRDIGKLFKAAAAVTLTVKIDQGGSGNKAIDRLIIPAGHNFAGMTLDIKYSTDDNTYTPAVTQWQGAAGNIIKEWSSLTKQYWKFIITSPGAIPYFAELFLTSTYEWEQNPFPATKPLDPEPNVRRMVNARKQPRFLVLGDSIRQRIYRVINIASAQRTNIEALNAVWAGHKLFWIYDHEGTLFYVELLSRINLEETEYGFSFDFNVSEIIK